MGWWEDSGHLPELPGFVSVDDLLAAEREDSAASVVIPQDGFQWVGALSAEIGVDGSAIVEESLLYVFESRPRVCEVIERVQGKWC